PTLEPVEFSLVTSLSPSASPPFGRAIVQAIRHLAQFGKLLWIKGLTDFARFRDVKRALRAPKFLTDVVRSLREGGIRRLRGDDGARFRRRLRRAHASALDENSRRFRLGDLRAHGARHRRSRTAH